MSETGLVTSRHRRHVIAETVAKERLQCLVRGRKLRPLVGDIVSIERLDDGTAVVADVAERKTLLSRIDSRGRAEGVAANVTQLVIVIASEPAPDWNLVDRYLAAAELNDIAAVLVWNKSDLADTSAWPRSAIYPAIGYQLIATSATSGSGVEPLRDALKGHRSVLVGQSGAGKSSLINCLLGEDLQATGQLSERRALGRHTTTAAELYRLPDGGELIDSPGVRQYAPYLKSPENLDWAFRELRPFLGHCRFDNCRHEMEPGCAVKAAVAAGEITAERLQSYMELRRVLAETAQPSS